MRRVIEGHKYDSGTARVVGTWDDGLDRSDPHWVQETLHCTRAGLYFVHGEGGGLTQYATLAGQTALTSWETIAPYSADGARAWAEEHLDADAYEAEWGEVDEGETHSLRVVVGEATWRRLQSTATYGGTTVSEVVRGMISDGLGAE